MPEVKELEILIDTLNIGIWVRLKPKIYHGDYQQKLVGDFCLFGVYKSDVSVNDNTQLSMIVNERNHPHPVEGYSEKLANEWQHITKDSFITSCTPINIKMNLKSNLMEIIKYSMKFNDLPNDKLVEIYPSLYKQRFFGTLGFFYGLGLDNIKIDEFVSKRKYIEFVMNYTKGLWTFEEKTKEIDYEILDSNDKLIDLFTKEEEIILEKEF